MKNFIFRFLYEKIKTAVIIALIIAAVVFIVFGNKTAAAYLVGFLTGCINFVLLSLGSDIIVLIRPRGARIIQFLFFVIRYILIALITVRYVLLNNANIFAVIGGLITMNFSIVISVRLSKKVN